MDLTRLKAAVLLSTALLFAPLAKAVTAMPAVAALTPFEASYQVTRGGSDYGQASRTLEALGDDRFRLNMQTDIEWLFLSDNRHFKSEFKVIEGQVQAESFWYSRTGTGSNKSFAAEFNRAEQQIINLTSGETVDVAWQANLRDESAALIQLQLDLAKLPAGSANPRWNYTVLDEKGQLDKLTFELRDQVELELPYGKVTALEVVRVRENSKRETIYWFAPELGYNLVKMRQANDGDETATLVLTHYQARR